MGYPVDDVHLCHFCNSPMDEIDLGEHMTDYNGRELYFCSRECLVAWDTADAIGDDYDDEYN